MAGADWIPSADFRCDTWLATRLPPTVLALTFRRTVHVRPGAVLGPPEIRHELCHVRQFERYGTVRFVLLYIVEQLRHGYRANRFELEARAEAQKTGVDACGNTA